MRLNEITSEESVHYEVSPSINWYVISSKLGKGNENNLHQ